MAEENEVVKADERKPWIVCEMLPDRETDETSFVEVARAGDFKVQVEADDWIKNNITGVNTLVSIRRGKAFKAVVKTTEVQF